MGLLGRCKVLAVVIAVFIFFHSSLVIAADTKITATKAQLRALFIKKIPKYVLWPEQSNVKKNVEYTVAAIDKEELAPYFSKLGPYKLVRWPTDSCHVLFIDSLNPRVIAAIIKQVQNKPILTIGQNSDFLRMGGIINLVESGSRMKLQVNICAAHKAGLSISSKLLKLSEIFCGDHLK
ncbi:YfiR family protein [Desulfovibrio sp. UCD-KL4C]|uniref:YfiR family protein n=1 Tax=Desulfovibrio sp. UCD-KL4C TaxID=2578120 RepID=UPI0025C30BAB|nr:YfiR family protein [Desulfovibrio sp. UCD-KL4C]